MKRVYLDLDGVLVDFVGGALKHHGLTIPYHECRWDFWRQAGITDQDFWSSLGRPFWANLEFMPDGPRILETVEQLFGERVALLSSPCLTDGCMDGKRDWVMRNLPAKWRRKLCLMNAKELLASPEALLVDDSDNNVDAYRLAGGFAYLIPRPWNRDHAADSRNGAMTPVAFDRFTGALYEFEHTYRISNTIHVAKTLEVVNDEADYGQNLVYTEKVVQ